MIFLNVIQRQLYSCWITTNHCSIIVKNDVLEVLDVRCWWAIYFHTVIGYQRAQHNTTKFNLIQRIHLSCFPSTTGTFILSIRSSIFSYNICKVNMIEGTDNLWSINHPDINAMRWIKHTWRGAMISAVTKRCVSSKSLRTKDDPNVN